MTDKFVDSKELKEILRPRKKVFLFLIIGCVLSFGAPILLVGCDMYLPFGLPFNYGGYAGCYNDFFAGFTFEDRLMFGYTQEINPAPILILNFVFDTIFWYVIFSLIAHIIENKKK